MIRYCPIIKLPFYREFSSIGRLMKHEGNLKSYDSVLETDEVISENNPWSPTLYNDVVRIRKPGSFISTALPEKFRLSYSALYEAPSTKYVALLRRITLSFSVIGIYGAKLFYDSPQFDDIFALSTICATSIPAIFVQFKTKDYVTRIFRLYNKEEPQTLENLVKDEKLVIEKLNFTGGKTYNELLSVNNPSLKLYSFSKLQALAPMKTWVDTDVETKKRRAFYVVDNIGGIKMDRIWGIIEHNSGVNNGRYMEREIFNYVKQ